MRVSAASYAVLGLKPGADRDAIEKAYRRLIKRHHPDRAGGDGARAAEINRAYFELRGRRVQELDEPKPSTVAEAIYMRRATRTRVPRPRPRGRSWKPLVLLALLIAASVWRVEIGARLTRLSAELRDAMAPAVTYRAASMPEDGPDPLEAALNVGAVRDSIRQAQSLVGGRGIDRAADASRACHRTMRLAPSAEQLDRCAALDFTVVAIARNDVLQDDGPFSASAVTAREMSAAKLLSDDYMLIEARFDQIRTRVDATVDPKPLAPPLRQATGADD